MRANFASDPFSTYAPNTSDLDIASSAAERTTFIPAPRTPSPSPAAPRDIRQGGRVSSLIAHCDAFVSKNTGLLLVAASQAFFASMNAAVKKLNSLDPPVPALELVFVRMAITDICCITYMVWKQVPDPLTGPKGVRLLLAFRGFSGFFGLFGVYYSLQYLSLSDATVLTFLSPLSTALVGHLVLAEAFSRRQALAGAVSLLGVVLIARPQALFGAAAHPPPPSTGDSAGAGGVPDTPGASEATPAQRLGAVGVALLGVLGSTGAYTSLRAIGTRAHTLHSLTSFATQCVIASAAGMLVLGIPPVVPTRPLWLALLVMIGVFGFTAQVLLIMGLQRETAGRGTMAIYVQIVFAGVLERVVFRTAPDALSVVGTLVIMGAATYVAVTKDAPRPPHAPGTWDDRGLESGLALEDARADGAPQVPVTRAPDGDGGGVGGDGAGGTAKGAPRSGRSHGYGQAR